MTSFLLKSYGTHALICKLQMEIEWEVKSYLFYFFIESAVVRSELEVVLQCENFHNALCGHAPVVIVVSRFIVGYFNLLTIWINILI